MRLLKAIIAAVLATLVGAAASCGTMGGGGMRYLAEPPTDAVEARKA